MAGSRSTEQPALRPWRTALLELDRSERLAAAGALIVAASLFFPWYGFPFNRDLVTTGFGAFGLVQGALLLTVGAAAALILEHARGRLVPRPLREGTLLIAAGAWSAILVGFAMIDRPSVSRGGFDHSYSLRYGVIVALAGAVVLIAGGVRRRRDERTD